MIQTVLGKISAAELGFCQMHEHLFVTEGPAIQKNPALLVDDVALSSKEVAHYRACGGGSILDAQPVFSGRDAGALKQISQASGVNIIAVTGYHLPFFYPAGHPVFTMEEDALFELFDRELSQGCTEDASVLPGAVKAALDGNGCEGLIESRYRAAVRAAAKAQVPIIIHTEKGVGGVKAVEIALEAGIPRNRIVVCHIDRQADDYAPHDAVAETGVMLEYDTIGRFKYHDDESEIRLIQHLLEKGCEGQLLFSLDTTRQRMKSYGGEIGLDYLFERFLPALKASGISDALIRKITVDNPRAVFE